MLTNIVTYKILYFQDIPPPEKYKKKLVKV